jgi:hypothetical protein
MDILTSERLRHLVLAGTAEARPFTQRNQGRQRGPSYPSRDPNTHGMALAAELSAVSRGLAENQERRAAQGLAEVTGSYVTFDLLLNPDLSLDRLEDRRAGIERVAFQIPEEGKGVVTVFVPTGKLSVFEAKLKAYLDPEKANQDGKRRHETLLNSIEKIRRTVLRDLWTDPVRDFPTATGPLWWELWLRRGVNPDRLREQARRLGFAIGDKSLRFPDRTVVLARATLDQMVLSVDLLDAIAELRSARSFACELLEMPSREEAERVADLRRRLGPPPDGAPAVCILDTGVDVGHPLLEPGLAPENAHSYNPESWGVDDRHGHGTEMAGFALFGDRLEESLLSDERIELRHQLESIKILRAPGTNPPELYGEITLASAARVEVQNASKPRAFSLSITDPETRSPEGEPTSWSAALDLLCSGGEEEERPSRLVFVSSGNAGRGEGYSYPDSNQTDRIHDPGQSWNALTIGAYTEKDLIHEDDYRDWPVVAPAGDMSPCNTTSLTWGAEWPNKPDLLLEGGNMAWNPSTGVADSPESLSLLTTRRRQDSRLLCWSGETSAATACAARLGALVLGEYPQLWPETVRALLVHSARWTPAMERRFQDSTPRRRVENLLRCYGWGVPDLDRALYSLRHQTTLVVQETIQPFRMEVSQAKSSEMHLHRIPWPREVLSSLGETRVRMRTTLSYFIEPKPGKRGASRRHRYASYGLRFDVKTATESEREFLARINQAERGESGERSGGSDAQEWLIGPQGRSRGSIHSDVWIGTAAALAAKDAIAVYPTLGWWRDPKRPDRCERQARYSLVVSIESEEATVQIEGVPVLVDFYTEISNQIEISGQIEIWGS